MVWSAVAGALGGKAVDFIAGEKAADNAFERNIEFYKQRYQLQVADLKAAGLNPMLAYTQGAPAMSQPMGSTGGPTDIPGAMQKSSAVDVNREIVAKTRAEKELAEANAAKARGDTLSPGVADRLAISQAAERSQAAITGVASAGEIKQRTINLEKEVDRIAADITRILAEARVKDQEPDLRRAETDLKRIERERIDLELPASEAKGKAGKAVSRGLDSTESMTDKAGHWLGGKLADMRDKLDQAWREQQERHKRRGSRIRSPKHGAGGSW